jgi:hypothetical protein
MVAKGDAVAYRSFWNETWDAVVTNVRPDPAGVVQHVDIDVTGPGLTEPMALHAIRWITDPQSTLPGARPK